MKLIQRWRDWRLLVVCFLFWLVFLIKIGNLSLSSVSDRDVFDLTWLVCCGIALNIYVVFSERVSHWQTKASGAAIEVALVLAGAVLCFAAFSIVAVTF